MFEEFSAKHQWHNCQAETQQQRAPTPRPHLGHGCSRPGRRRQLQRQRHLGRFGNWIMGGSNSGSRLLLLLISLRHRADVTLVLGPASARHHVEEGDASPPTTPSTGWPITLSTSETPASNAKLQPQVYQEASRPRGQAYENRPSLQRRWICCCICCCDGQQLHEAKFRDVAAKAGLAYRCKTRSLGKLHPLFLRSRTFAQDCDGLPCRRHGVSCRKRAHYSKPTNVSWRAVLILTMYANAVVAIGLSYLLLTILLLCVCVWCNLLVLAKMTDNEACGCSGSISTLF